MMFSNLDTFYYENNNFLKWIAPYSIFPFSDEICIKLMTWEIIINTYINIDLYIDIYKKNGWEVEKVDSKSNFKNISNKVKKQSWLFWEEKTDDTYLIIRKNGYFQTIPVLEIFRICFEFISPNSILMYSEEQYKKALKEKNREDKWYAINFTNDNNIFN
jgi:hypothetical protein